MSRLYCDYLLRGKMNVDDLVTHRLSPSEAPQIYQSLLKDRSNALGVIFNWLD
jgi:threonine dehydrogenase-like Zn-dependent dehydrogenase